MEKYLCKNLPVESRVDDLLIKLTVKEKLSLMAHSFKGIERLNIPAYTWWNEALHGIARAGKATIFPLPIGLGATFNSKLVRKIFNAVSDEGRAKYNFFFKENGYTNHYQGITFWTPNINIFRDPRWGRGQETYGEDPYLTKIMGIQVVNGLQGDYKCDDYKTQHQTGKYLKTSACAKHFVAYSGVASSKAPKREGTFNAKPTEKDFRETYLPAFKALSDAGVEAFMTCYHRVYDEVPCASNYLINDILRNEWNFHGQVVSDCWAVKDLLRNKIVDTEVDAVALAIKTGCDLNCGNYYQDFGFQAYEQGKITEEDIDQCVRRNLRSMFKLGMMDQLESVPYNNIPYDVVCSKEHRELSYHSALESCVLLKNDGILPLSSDKMKSLMLTGPYIADIDVLLGIYHGMSTKIVSCLEGLTRATDKRNMMLDYRKGCLPYGKTLNPLDWAIFESKKHDCTILTVGYNSLLEGEVGDSIANTCGDREEIALPKEQTDFLDRYFAKGIETPIVLVVFGGSPVALGKYIDKVSAVLFAWYPGEEGGNAIADILFGEYSPSGKLPLTFPKSLDDIPGPHDYTMTGRTYKYLTKEPEFPFGFGLSYADFTHDSLKVHEITNEEIIISVSIKNNSHMIADEVTQVYVKDNNQVAGQPHLKLCAFTKTTLQGQESKTLELVIRKEDISYYDDNASLIIPNNLTIFCGSSQPDDLSKKLTSKSPQSITLTF